MSDPIRVQKQADPQTDSQSSPEEKPKKIDDLLDLVDFDSEPADDGKIFKEGFDLGQPAPAEENPPTEEAGEDDEESVYMKDNVVMRRI